jgi:ABC-type multidrug transport system ATPase subunit
MKQRLKIGLAILSQSSVLVLDEPGANLDAPSKQWFQSMLAEYLGQRILIIASNDPEDYKICDQFLDISEFKD